MVVIILHCMHNCTQKITAFSAFLTCSYCYDCYVSFFSSGYFWFNMVPLVYPVGESNVSFVCSYWFYAIRELKNMSLDIQFRRNANDNWTSVVESNRSGVLWKSENTFFSFTILSVLERDTQYDPRVTLKGSVQSKQCTIDPMISPDLRCVLSDESQIIDSSEKTVLSIKGIC